MSILGNMDIFCTLATDTDVGKEAGIVTNRRLEQFDYAYDAAGNLNRRTNNTLLQWFNVNSLNELTTVTNGKRLTWRLRRAA